MNSQLKSQLLNVLVQKMKQEDNGLTNYYDKATLDKINYLTEEILFVGYVGQIYCEKRLSVKRKRVCKKDPDYYYY